MVLEARVGMYQLSLKVDFVFHGLGGAAGSQMSILVKTGGFVSPYRKKVAIFGHFKYGKGSKQ